MENEQLLTAVIDEANNVAKGFQKMRSKYVFDTRPGDLLEIFEQDAAEWMKWHKLGVQ